MGKNDEFSRAPQKGGADNWVDYLSQVELPVLAQTLRDISNLTESNTTTVNQLADVILRDADLTSKVLRLSNTIFYNYSRLPVSTVSRAITLIGFDSVRAMAISSLVIDALVTKNPRSHLLRCLAKALHAAVQARCLLPDANQEQREEVFIGALLSNIGEMAFWACRTPHAEELDVRMNMEESLDAQKRILGTTFGAITRGLADTWSLGPFVKEVVSSKGAGSKSIAVVRQSMALAESAEDGWRSSAVDKALRDMSRLLEIPLGTLRDSVQVNAQEAAKIAVSYGMREVAPLLPGQEDGEEAEAETISRGDPILQLQILRELSAMLVENPDLNLICQTVVEGIHRAVGMERAVLLMRGRSSSHMTARKILGSGTDHWRDHFVVNLDQPGILTAGATKPTPCLFAKPDDPDWKGLAPPDFDKHIGRHPGLFGPLYVRDRVIGLIYADNGAANALPNREQFMAFSHFVQQAQLCINNLS